jgi:hypothetical protein
MPHRYPGLEINEDLRHERREWGVQRVAWILLYLLLAAIALGLFGNGPLSKTVIGTDDAPLLEYERFMRHRSPDTLRVTAVPSGGKVTVALGRRYLQRIAIQQIEPVPERVVAGVDATQFIFSAVSTQAVEVLFEIRPDRVGSADGWIAVNGGERHRFSQFVYP